MNKSVTSKVFMLKLLLRFEGLLEFDVVDRFLQKTKQNVLILSKNFLNFWFDVTAMEVIPQ